MLVRIRRGAFVLKMPDGTWERPDPQKYFRDTDPLVKQHRWAFASDAELAAEQGLVEQATRAPGERRSVSRPKVADGE